jgi:3-oxoacyl-[acyl-carrier protein] reductase
MWGQVGASCEAAYSATKGAVDALTKALSKELGPSGIRVNAISPGWIDTDMNRFLTADDRGVLAEETLLGRPGTAEEVADALWMLSQSSYITGQVLGVNGGMCII